MLGTAAINRSPHISACCSASSSESEPRTRAEAAKCRPAVRTAFVRYPADKSEIRSNNAFPLSSAFSSIPCHGCSFAGSAEPCSA